MTEPSGRHRHRLRGFLASRKHKRQPSDPEDLLRASITSSVTSLPESAVVAMEGSLKKRLAKMPVMHDRYCVATWELDADERKRVMLRSYKSHKAYDTRPEKPSSVQQLKCISDWDGKTGFHRYQHAFTMETRDKKLFQCVASCAADKVKWMGLMVFNSRRDMRLGSVGNLVSLRRSQSVEAAADSGKPRAYTNPTVAQSDVNEDQSVDMEEQSNFPGHDGLFRTTSGASVNSLELPIDDKNEPVDWGLCGNEETTYKYEVQENSKPVLLDKELLDARGETRTLATDRFLFEEAGASRFGAVVVKGAGRDEEDDDDADYVDEDFAAREAQKENEKNMKRRAQKLESNRDLYAEMAAARLAGMRKDARHQKKRHGHSRVRLSAGSEESDVEMHDEDQSEVVEGEIEGVAELEDMNQRRSSLRSRRSSKSHKKSFVSTSENASNDGHASGEDEEVEQEEEEGVYPAALISTQMAEAGSGEAEKTEADIAEAEELRQLKKKHRAERRAKKRLMREKEEEERTALEAAELAQAHREEQRAREEAKAREEQQKRDKKERREMKQKLKREKAKQRQAEAEFQKLVELKQAEEEEREREHKEKKKSKKSKKKEKYTSPAERIHRKEERDAERVAAAEEAEANISNALVIVEKPADTKPVQQPVAAPAPAPVLSVQTGAAPTQQAAFASAPSTVPASLPAPVPDAAPAVASSSAAKNTAAAAAQAMPIPMYQMSPPPFVPSYPTGPQSMPAYGLAATFGAYPPFYLAPYSYGGPTGLQPAFMRPNMGFVAGLSAMNSFGTTAGPAPASSAEPMIGPQLPIPEERAEASSTGASPPPFPPPSPSASTKLTNLPELPDVIEF